MSRYDSRDFDSDLQSFLASSAMNAIHLRFFVRVIILQINMSVILYSSNSPRMVFLSISIFSFIPLFNQLPGFL